MDVICGEFVTGKRKSFTKVLTESTLNDNFPLTILVHF